MAEGRLNPLHCGAVVASLPRRGEGDPFACLNPLHCGAVVASGCWKGTRTPIASSQSPSLRGSGRFPRPADALRRQIESQSPSLRGSGRFEGGYERRQDLRDVSIPFIAGQWSLRSERALVTGMRLVSIPFIAGQWSLPGRGRRRGGPRPGLNPLHCGAVVAFFRAERGRKKRERQSQSPSLRGSGRFKRRRWKGC